MMEMSDKQIQAGLAMLYLCGCVLTDTRPDMTKLGDVSLRALYGVSCFHSLTAMVCEALERAELTGEDSRYFELFQRDKQRAIRKNLLLDTERARLSAFMEETGIWYMPLKGVVLKELYPKMGLRQMADNDILFDAAYRQTIRDWFEAQGYDVHLYGKTGHDVYLKAPIYNYEMHVTLYGEFLPQRLRDYYKDVKARLIPDREQGYGYHFTDEDFYVYFVSHGFKHFSGDGTGLRFLLDMYVYLESKQSAMDFDYIEQELSVLELWAFERDCRGLVREIFADISSFDGQTLSPERRKLLTEFLSGGTYGTIEQGVQKTIDRQGKLRYLLGRFFPGTEVLRFYHPLFRHKLLMPIGWVYRGVKILTLRSGRAARELRAVFKGKRNEP